MRISFDKRNVAVKLAELTSGDKFVSENGLSMLNSPNVVPADVVVFIATDVDIGPFWRYVVTMNDGCLSTKFGDELVYPVTVVSIEYSL
jgi:hypothetical protein